MKNFLMGLMLAPTLCLADGSWEKIESPQYWSISMYRQSVPHGWLVHSTSAYGPTTTFVADEDHKWKASPDE